MRIREITNFLESYAPLAIQEEYDNSGLLIGDPDAETAAALVSLDLTVEVMKEAAEKKCGLVITHHPFIFRGLKRITRGRPEYEIINLSMAHGIAIYAIHTNLDNSVKGLNSYLCGKLGLKECRILSPKKGLLFKLVTFCPVDHADKLRQALFDAGAGQIGNYDSCSYNLDGFGTFRGGEDSNPFVGKKNEVHREPETRIEVIFPGYLEKDLVRAMKQAHPYEEVAFDIYPLSNEFGWVGAGMTGVLENPMAPAEFLAYVKSVLGLPVIRHSSFTDSRIHKVAVCSGSGAFLIREAAAAGMDAYLTGDLKYHDFQEPGPHLLLADIGHYESEQWVKQLIYEVLIQKFPTFAVLFSEREQNPVKYL